MEKALRVPVNIKLNMSQLWTLAAKEVSSILGCIRKVEEGELPPLLSAGETHLVCYVQFRAPQYKRDMDTGVSRAKGC